MFRAVAIAIALFSTPALAETTVKLEVLRAQEVTSDTGVVQTVLEQVTSALPGDALIYRITLDNTANDPATAVGLTLPIDPALSIDPSSLTSEGALTATFSADGGKSFDLFENLSVIEEGSQRPATPDDLTHLRVGLAEIPAKTAYEIRYSVIVD